MCGICGIVGIESKEAAEAPLRRMMSAIRHRGPDEAGAFVAPPVALGAQRLSIVDLSGGSQPVWNEERTLAVVFNGEIYNFPELRSELEGRGHKFRSRCDTEVVVHAYEAWGEDCLKRFLGMFAFALVEFAGGPGGRPATVFFARDRLGIKPLYFTLQRGALWFASEVRALLASGTVAAQLSPEALPSYLLFGSLSEPVTLVEGIHSLPPGHFIKLQILDGISAVEPKSWWDAASAGKRGVAERGGSAARVRALLENATRSHLNADVPVGVFLSSGLDSTALAALASRAQNRVHTFTVAFSDADFSEAEKARRTAARLGTAHSELALSGQDLLARLDEAVAAFDLPSMDGVNTYFVSWAARQAGLKVALSGLGSDELFGGYTSFRVAAPVTQIASAARKVPGPLRAWIATPLEEFLPAGQSRDARQKALAAWRDPALFPHPYFFTRALFTPQAAASWLHSGPDGWSGSPWGRWLAQAAREADEMDTFTGVSWLELRSYLVNTLLRDTDAMSMAHSLEVRVPFLDSPLVEYVLSLPASAKFSRQRSKSLLVEALKDLLPDEIVAQPKRTFTFPWENWLRGPLAGRVAAGLEEWSPALAAHLNGDSARGVWKDFLDRRTTWSRPWSLYVLNEWAKRNLRGQESAAREPRQTATSLA